MTSLLLFLSGFAALVYQVFWMRDLAIVFGNSAHAAAVDLAVFFAGLAAGAALFARFAPRVSNPLRTYGLLELGVAVSALLFFVLLDAYRWIYVPLYRQFSGSVPALVLVKSILALGVLGLPTMFMGATLPAMVQHGQQAQRRGREGRTQSSAWLYGMNTLGATVGAFAAGFLLPPTLGFRGGYLLAVAANVIAGAAALLNSRAQSAIPDGPSLPRSADRRRPAARADSVDLSPRLVAVLAFASGALSIGLEVVWLRMFAQVLDNSVYAFSAILVVALVAFALASLVAARMQIRRHPVGWIGLVLALCGGAVAIQPPIFIAFTDGLTEVASGGWIGYVTEVFGMAAIFVGAVGLVIGLVFPLLLRFTQAPEAAGATVGRLVTINTAGAILGSLVTTFALFPTLGVWTTFAAIGAVYPALGVWVAWRPQGRAQRPVAALMLAGAIVMVGVSTTLPRLRLDRDRGEHVLDLWEGSHGTVAVTESRDGRLLRMNNSYWLGGTVDRIERERIQALLPLLLHPDPKRVFFLGLGTGITAGEAVRHPVQHIVVCELVPEVVRASQEYFGAWTRGLAADPRVDIRVEDGRQYLAAADETFDVIVSDLFVPWHAGTGMLYTREHFETVRARLAPRGLFVQWLPLFQLNQRDFEVIARTLVAVFPHVVLWRGDFYSNKPIVGLVASSSPMRLDPARLISGARTLVPGTTEAATLAAVLPYYVGNLSDGRAVLGPGALNTDQRPIVEYLSPLTQWTPRAEEGSWFVSMPLVRFFARLRASAPLDRDPYLSALSFSQRRYIEAGTLYYRAIVARVRGEDEAAQADVAEVLDRLPAETQVGGPFMALDSFVQ